MSLLTFLVRQHYHHDNLTPSHYKNYWPSPQSNNYSVQGPRSLDVLKIGRNVTCLVTSLSLSSSPHLCVMPIILSTDGWRYHYVNYFVRTLPPATLDMRDVGNVFIIRAYGNMIYFMSAKCNTIKHVQIKYAEHAESNKTICTGDGEIYVLVMDTMTKSSFTVRKTQILHPPFGPGSTPNIVNDALRLERLLQRWFLSRMYSCMFL